MNGRIQQLAAVGAFAVYAAVGAAAFAQPTAPPTPGPAGPHARMMSESPAERSAHLRDLLQLRPAQEPALQTYVAALDQAHRGMMAGFGPGGAMPATTPERLARMQQMMAQRQGMMTTVIEATRRFYDQLDAGQKKAFDALPMMMMHGGGMGMMGGGGMGMMGGGPRGGMGMMDGPGGPPPAPADR